jgi:hypothetical protein
MHFCFAISRGRQRRDGEEKNITRTEGRVIVPRDVALHTGYHDRLARPAIVVVDETVHVHAFEGITVLCGAAARPIELRVFEEPSHAWFFTTRRGHGGRWKIQHLFTVVWKRNVSGISE